MATTLKNIDIKKGFGSGIVSSQVKNHSNDPFIVKKIEEASQTIQRVGLPGKQKK